MSPEIWREEDLEGYASDVWSAGVCLYIMLTGNMLYGKPDDLSYKCLVKGETYRLLAHYEKRGATQISQEAKDLLAGLLHPDQHGRLTVEEIKNHTWMRMETHNRDIEQEQSQPESECKKECNQAIPM